MHANDLRSSLAELNRSIIRPRPWFEPGVWGGKWMRSHIQDLSKDLPNYAWSFELIAPENGVLLVDDQRKLLEFSFDLLMYSDSVALMGTQRFGFEFPIRFDFLDTFDGQNLSIQCHAGREYLEKNFGETMPQDESYYIVDAREDARVYLGFHEDISREDFRLV
jgi:mannose-6-phosphate isomerase class I